MVEKELPKLGQTPSHTEARLGLYEDYPRLSSSQCQIVGREENLNTQKHKAKHEKKKNLDEKSPEMQVERKYPQTNSVLLLPVSLFQTNLYKVTAILQHT